MFYQIKTRWQISYTNEFNGFYMMAKLQMNGLSRNINADLLATKEIVLLANS